MPWSRAWRTQPRPLGHSFAASRPSPSITKTMFDAMDFSFLFDPTRQLFSIGYRVADTSLDPNCYDLLASEARLTSFVAIAKGDVPSSHWFRLGRALTPVDRGSALVSWSGSMFEYLMPALVMRSPSGSLLDQTYRLVVRRQMAYGAERGVPWGVSESAYNARDLELTYQYSNFGVPGLGLKRGLSEDVVVAPYATALAAMIDPAAAARNFGRLAEAGGSGPYGFYEALDYTGTRLPEGDRWRSYAPTWRITRGCRSSRSRTSCTRAYARALSRGTDRAGDRAAAAGADAPQTSPSPDLGPRKWQAAANVRDLVPPVVRRFTSPHDPTPAHAPSFQRAIRRDGDGRRLRIQPLARPRRHALARRRHARCLGDVYLPA